MSLSGRREVLADPQALAKRVADWLLELALAKDGAFAICLSGGSTPKRLYQLLGEPPYRDAFPWARTHLFFGDERFVPSGDPLSNSRMVREALVSRIDVPPGNFHAIPTDGGSAQTSAAAYEETLKSFYGADALRPERPLFDVNLLGLGEDGHTASLFPGTAALDERKRWVVGVVGAKAEDRVTLTYPTLESSRRVAFLVEGDGKRNILKQLAQDANLPAARLRPHGELVWFLDRAAAGTLD